MRILSAASAFPPHYYSQQSLIEGFQRHWDGRLENPKMLEWLHSRVGVEGRHLTIPIEEYGHLTFGETNNRWIEAAQDLGEQAICKALSASGIAREALGAFFFVSVTGISAPSVDALLVNRMGLSPNIRRIPIFGLGCVAGAAGISRAADYVRAYPKQAALLLSVELCSLTLQSDDLSMANLISSGLFGDGAAAVIVAGAEFEGPGSEFEQPGAEFKQLGPEIVATRSILYPDTEKVMGWDISEKGFQVVLSAEVPNTVRAHLGQDVDVFLAEVNLTRGDIGSWIIHTGGPKVLEATQESLGLANGALDVSWKCLRRTGNLSSASVLMVLEEFMGPHRPAPDTWSVLAAMGPGFCSELVLLRW